MLVRVQRLLGEIPRSRAASFAVTSRGAELIESVIAASRIQFPKPLGGGWADNCLQSHFVLLTLGVGSLSLARARVRACKRILAIAERHALQIDSFGLSGDRFLHARILFGWFLPIDLSI